MYAYYVRDETPGRPEGAGKEKKMSQQTLTEAKATVTPKFWVYNKDSVNRFDASTLEQLSGVKAIYDAAKWLLAEPAAVSVQLDNGIVVEFAGSTVKVGE